MILRRKMLLLFHVIILSCASALGSSSSSSYVTIGDNNITTSDIKDNPYYNITPIPFVRKYLALLKKGNIDKRKLSATNNRALSTSNSKIIEHFTTWSFLESSGEISNRSHQFRAKMQRPESSLSTSAIWKTRRRRRNLRYPRDTSGQEMDGKPVITITVHIRNRRASVKDFTQVNRNVCPPSLCRIADERSRGGVERPRGTGGTVFYQGDIVLDRNLDRFIYPRTTSAPSQQMRRRNQNGSRKSSQSSRRRRNNKQSRGRNRKRTKTNTRRPKRESTEEESSKDSDDHLNRNSTNLSRNVKSRGKRRRTVQENIRRRTKRSSRTGSWYESEADAGGSQWHKQERSGRTRRATMKLRNRLWKNGVVIYKMAREINPEAKRVIRGAINHIQQRTCVRFREKKSSDRDFIRFISEPGCWSQIGRVGGTQMVSLGRGCESLGTAVHEIVHSLGVWHEQARPDRNRFVRIIEENISEKFRPDFEVVGRRLAADRGYSYDYQSLMHYSKYAFTRNGEPTIQVIGPGRRLKLRIGQRRGLSTIDISQLRDMYKCNLKTDIKETVCHKGWVKHYTSCYKFVTSPPAQFEAAHRACKREKANLLVIQSSREQRFIDKVLNKNYTSVYKWRTAGRKVNGTMVWYLGEKSVKNITKYENWARGHPGSRTSLVLARDQRAEKVTWMGEMEGGSRTPYYYRHPYICEKPARRKCVELRYRDGRDYRGHMDHTRDGYTCQRWTENYPHDHPLVNVSRAAAARMREAARVSSSSSSSSNNSRAANRISSDGLGSHNKCRNPSGLRRNRPWCYTSKRRHEWGYCDISVCASSIRPTTRSGQMNQRQRGGSGQRRGTPRAGTPRTGNRSRRRGSSREGHTRRGDTTRRQGVTRQPGSRRSRGNQGRAKQETSRQGTLRRSLSRKGILRQGARKRGIPKRGDAKQVTPTRKLRTLLG